MAKKKQRRPSRKERDQAGCISGIITMFDFRQGRSTTKLLADKRRANKQANGTMIDLPLSKNSRHLKCNSIEDTEEDEVPMSDISTTSVKKLMEEEMTTDTNLNSERDSSKGGNRSKKNDPRKDGAAGNKSNDLLRMMEEFVKDDHQRAKMGSNEIPSNKAIASVDDKLVSAVKLLKQRRRKQKQLGSSLEEEESSEFFDALEMLSANKGLFLKLLHDPSFEDVPLGKDGQVPCSLSEFPEDPPSVTKSDESQSKHRSFFRRRSRSLSSYPFVHSPEISAANKNSSSRFSGGDSNNNKAINTGHASQFSFTEIKRRLKHAMGRDTSASSKFSSKHQNSGWSSPNRDHFYTERFTLSSTSLRKDEQRAVGSNIYVEAKKHISEILNNGEGNVGPIKGRSSKPLGRFLSLPSYNNSPSPCFSPRKGAGESSITTPTRLSSDCVNDDEVKSMEIQDCTLDIQPSFADAAATVHEAERSSSVVEEIEETTESSTKEEESIPCESGNCSIANGDAIEEDNEESALISSEGSSPCSESGSSEEDQCVNPPTNEKIERPSPISTLEPSFTDDEITPQSSITPQAAEKKYIEPRHIDFEDQSDQFICCTRISPEDQESAFEYVEAVLLGSGLNWDEFTQRWLSSDEILDQSLFEEVGSFSGKSRHDQKLLFDCANESLKEICQNCFGGIVPCLKVTKIRRVLPRRGMELINEVWARAERVITSIEEPLSLDNLVKRDLTTSTEWMDLRLDFELIGNEMEDAVFDELVEDVVLSFEWMEFDSRLNS